MFLENRRGQAGDALMQTAISRLQGALVVSSQASEGEPLCQPTHIRALAESTIIGGAKGLRLEGAANIAACRQITDLPIIGLAKSKTIPDSERLRSVYITASFDEASELAAAGADIIALDATQRPRVGGLTVDQLMAKIHNELKVPILADVSTLEEGIAAARSGADMVSTTLAGYTEGTKALSNSGPAFELLRSLIAELDIPVLLEGRIWHPEEVAAGLTFGAYAVVVGSAITRPQLITARFAQATQTANLSRAQG